MRIQSSPSQCSLDQLVLFPFDDGAIPLQRGVQLHLNSHRATCGRTRIVLAPGPEGAPDSEHVAYYGTVIRLGDELWMWYLGQGADDTWFQRAHLAVSRDGYHWEKPSLGLVEYNETRDNNLVDMGAHGHIAACVVFHDPGDPDPARRFKMVFEDERYGNRFAVAFSPDGLRWSESPRNPVGPWFGMAGGCKIDDMYVIAGQGGAHIPGLFRQFASHISYDFENWSAASALGLQRVDVAPRPRVLGGPLASAAEREAHIISAPIDLEGQAAQLSLNVAGIHDYSGLSVEILDERLNPLPAFSRESCDLLKDNGYNQSVTWGGRK